MPHPLRSWTALAALALALGCPAGADPSEPVAKSDDRVTCTLGSNAASVSIGSIPAGTKIAGSVERRVETGDRVSVVVDGDAAVVCASDRSGALQKFWVRVRSGRASDE